jgi:ribosomal protein S18 acetylase RimI-like enzyme
MHIRLAEPRDIPYLVDIAVQVLNSDAELSVFLRPNRYKYPYTAREQIVIDNKLRLLNPNVILFVAETDPDDYEPYCGGANSIGRGPKGWKGEPRVTGYAAWARKGDSELAKSYTRDLSLTDRLNSALNSLQRLYLSQPLFTRQMSSAHNLALLKATDYGAKPLFKPYGEHWYLVSLTVDARFSRRGIASLLTRWGMDKAAEEGVPVCLESTVAGQKVYEKLGFHTLGWLRCGPGENGARLDNKIMVWFPESYKGVRGPMEEEEKVEVTE